MVSVQNVMNCDFRPVSKSGNRKDVKDAKALISKSGLAGSKFENDTWFLLDGLVTSGKNITAVVYNAKTKRYYEIVRIDSGSIFKPDSFSHKNVSLPLPDDSTCFSVNVQANILSNAAQLEALSDEREKQNGSDNTTTFLAIGFGTVLLIGVLVILLNGNK